MRKTLVLVELHQPVIYVLTAPSGRFARPNIGDLRAARIVLSRWRAELRTDDDQAQTRLAPGRNDLEWKRRGQALVSR